MNTIHRENLVTAKRGAAVFAAGTAVAAAFFALTACESSSPGGKIEASTSSAVASSSASPGATTPAQGQYGQLAVQILDAIVRGDSATATAHFDRTMRQELTPDKLASNWDAYQQILGSYQSHGDPRQIPLGHWRRRAAPALSRSRAIPSSRRRMSRWPSSTLVVCL